jgi:cell division initiation protein
MKITPLEIRQKGFEKHFRGYDKDEVNAFLLTLSQEWERLQDEHKEYRIKLEAAEREVMKLREVESSLYRTLKTAEDTGANVIEQARHAADLHLRESQLKADEILNEAKMKANDAVDEAEQQSKMVLADMEERLRNLVEEYKKLESSRDSLLLELKRISEDTLERVERTRKARKDFDADQHLAETRNEIKKVIFPNLEKPASQAKQESTRQPVPENKSEPAESAPEPQVVIARETVTVETRTQKLTSFFDEIG